MRSYPTRFSMLHLKDLKPAPAGTEPDQRHSTIIGKGVVDFLPIFAAAKAIRIKHYFVEQEEFDGPVFPALQLDYKNANILARGGSLKHQRV
jgi:sugar phosphate isomerase/epimerase